MPAVCCYHQLRLAYPLMQRLPDKGFSTGNWRPKKTKGAHWKLHNRPWWTVLDYKCLNEDQCHALFSNYKSIAGDPTIQVSFITHHNWMKQTERKRVWDVEGRKVSKQQQQKALTVRRVAWNTKASDMLIAHGGWDNCTCILCKVYARDALSFKSRWIFGSKWPLTPSPPNFRK